MIDKIKEFIHKFRIYSYSRYSKYLRSEKHFTDMCKEAYPNVSSNLELFYRFRYNRITKNEILIIYSDRPGLVIGYKGDNIVSLGYKYMAIDKHCKDVKLYEVSKIKLK